MTKKFIWLAAVLTSLININAVQAGGWDDKFKDFLKKKITQPTQPTAPVSPSAPTPPSSAEEKPADLILKSLSSGKTSPEEELRIGQQIAGNLLGASPLVRDDGLQRYVNQVGRWAALQSEQPDLNWHFGVIDSEDINAFAAPGGYIFLTQGLYRKLSNEAELAAVLGHEMGHVLRKHHLKLLQKSQGIAALGSALSRKLKNEHEVVQNLIGNGAEVVARGLDKDAEFEADRIGVVLSARAGYDPYALPAVLAEIGHVAKTDKSVSLLFKTHPLPEVRLGRLSDSVGDKLDALPEGQSGAARFYSLH